MKGQFAIFWVWQFDPRNFFLLSAVQTIADCFYALSEINLVSGKYQEAQLMDWSDQNQGLSAKWVPKIHENSSVSFAMKDSPGLLGSGIPWFAASARHLRALMKESRFIKMLAGNSGVQLCSVDWEKDGNTNETGWKGSLACRYMTKCTAMNQWLLVPEDFDRIWTCTLSFADAHDQGYELGECTFA